MEVVQQMNSQNRTNPQNPVIPPISFLTGLQNWLDGNCSKENNLSRFSEKQKRGLIA